jgi:hypothetical protein
MLAAAPESRGGIVNENERREWEEFVAAIERMILLRPDQYSQPSERAILAAYKELKERREDEEFLLKHTSIACFDASGVSVDYGAPVPTIHAAIEQARGK